MKRIPQPPIQRSLRDPERHEFWPGFVTVVVGIVLLLCGTRHLTGIETVEGGTAWETQLVKAFSSGGLQYAENAPSAPPPMVNDPAANAAALERWAHQKQERILPASKIRVDTGAQTPCPT